MPHTVGVSLQETPAGPGWTSPVGTGRRSRACVDTAPAGPGELRSADWQIFDVPDGLPGPAVTSLLGDRAGHLWIGTSTGVRRLDGEETTSWTPQDGIAGGHVGALHQDSHGGLWMGSGRHPSTPRWRGHGVVGGRRAL